ncbi:MAG: hypothetical protein JXB23_09805 [Candidatus Aminicenantes bacterium]|nr:hypothetical protein [Candidatus Aminicenantes bacterium]
MRLYKLTTIALCLFFLRCGGTGAPTRSLTGNLHFDGEHAGNVIVALFKLEVPIEGQVSRLSKENIYGSIDPFRTFRLEKPAEYTFDRLIPGHYSVLAFIDTDGNGALGFDPPEPFGWFTSSPGGSWDPIDITQSNATGCDFSLRVPTRFPGEDKIIEHGSLIRMQGLPVLQLRGTAEERGFAHGYLIGKQILDFFEFYIIEDSWHSAKRYQETFVPFLEGHFDYPPEFLKECDAVIKGMIASEMDMRVEVLDRDFNRTDLLAINAYIERRAAYPGVNPSSCTQFAFWEAQTEGSKNRGGLIAARNMDGECDVRKVTVSHFLVYAVDPAESGHKRWVSTMWPGFIGTISGINEEGLYCMENAGASGPGPVPDGVIPCSWIQRIILEKQGSEASPESVIKMMKLFKCSTGGITAAGSIILWAVPFSGQISPAFVYEGGRTGFAVRLPSDVPPIESNNIMASNHHLFYGFNPERPSESLGSQVSFSSRWRYETGMHTLKAWSRLGKFLGLEEAKKLLQQVAHGTTEYSVIFLANEGRVLIAVDDLKTDMWDAPYMEWKEFHFDEFFEK